MANSWFQFKQFRVDQERCALKVGTDACILGAWAVAPSPTRILDIGTGTGLLALMLAQRYAAATIEALEPEPEAASQARQNFANSPWHQLLRLLPLRVQEFAPPPSTELYDLLVCNPPFYPHHLKAASEKRNLALHQHGLSFQELAQACSRLLTSDGLCYILLPPPQMEEFENLAAAAGLHACKRLLVRDRPGLPVHRSITAFVHGTKALQVEEMLSIRNEDNSYSDAFMALLQPYYLIF